MRLKKLLFLNISFLALFVIGFILEKAWHIEISWALFFVMYIVIGFELIRKELVTLRRAMNLSLNDSDLENIIIDQEYEK